jgi:hypothetical protein
MQNKVWAGPKDTFLVGSTPFGRKTFYADRCRLTVAATFRRCDQASVGQMFFDKKPWNRFGLMLSSTKSEKNKN